MDPENGQLTPFWTSREREKRGDFFAETVVIECGQPCAPANRWLGLESLIRVRQTESAFHRPAQQNAFRHRGACLQQRSFARENPRLRRSQLQLGLLRLLAMIFPNFILFERGSFP
jgi:hypothetical protein